MHSTSTKGFSLDSPINDSRIRRTLETWAQAGHAIKTFRLGNGDYQFDAWYLSPLTPTKGLVVFAHGTGSDAFYPNLNLFHRLIMSGWSIYTFDLPGHGHRTKSVLNLSSARHATMTAINHAQVLNPKIHCAGFSLGGNLLLDTLLTEETVAIESLTLIATPYLLNLTPWTLLNEVRSTLRLSFYKQIKYYGLFGIIPPLGPYRRQEYPIRVSSDTDHYGKFVRDLINSLDLLTRLKSRCLTLPVQLIYGTDDFLVPIEQACQLRDALPNAYLNPIARATHYTLLFEELTYRIMINFITAQTPQA